MLYSEKLHPEVVQVDFVTPLRLMSLLYRFINYKATESS